MSAARKKFTSFEEFWPHYLEEHSHPKNRLVHAIVTPVGIATTVGLALINPWLIPVGIAGLYGSLWGFGHAKYQGNKPATLQHPVWSFRADFKMISMIYSGKIDDEYRKYGMDPSGKDTRKLYAEGQETPKPAHNCNHDHGHGHDHHHEHGKDCCSPKSDFKDAVNDNKPEADKKDNKPPVPPRDDGPPMLNI